MLELTVPSDYVELRVESGTPKAKRAGQAAISAAVAKAFGHVGGTARIKFRRHVYSDTGFRYWTIMITGNQIERAAGFLAGWLMSAGFDVCE